MRLRSDGTMLAFLFRASAAPICVAQQGDLMDNRDRDFESEERDFETEDPKDDSDDSMGLDDPLGIAREPVTKDARIRASSDEESVRRRRKRAGLGPELEERSTGLGDLDMDPSGATGTDLGSRDRHQALELMR